MAKSGLIAATAFACLLVGGVGGYLLTQGQIKAPAVAVAEKEDTKAAAPADEDLQASIRQFILDNPEVLVQSLQGLQAKAATENLGQLVPAMSNDPDSPKAGAQNPKVTLIEFFDYHCGYCKQMFPAVKQALEEHPELQVVFRELPILSPDSKNASLAALAVSKLKPEAYLDFHGLLMSHRGQYSEEALAAFAQQVGVDAEALKKEMSEEWIQQELAETQQIAQAAGIQGTPAMIIGEELLPGAVSYDELDSKIRSAKSVAGNDATAPAETPAS